MTMGQKRTAFDEMIDRKTDELIEAGMTRTAAEGEARRLRNRISAEYRRRQKGPIHVRTRSVKDHFSVMDR